MVISGSPTTDRRGNAMLGAMVRRVGLTGGVASGKSTVAGILRELGAYVIDADALARAAVAPGSAGLAEVVRHFGDAVRASDGSLDRAALGQIVFADPDQRRVLEGIVHPVVRSLAAQSEAQAPPDAIVVHEIPLLVETGQAEDFDAVIVVDVPVALQVDRMVTGRGLSQEEAHRRIAAQAGREERLEAATYVVDNTGTYEDLRHAVTEVFASLCASGSGS